MGDEGVDFTTFLSTGCPGCEEMRNSSSSNYSVNEYRIFLYRKTVNITFSIAKGITFNLPVNILSVLNL